MECDQVERQAIRKQQKVTVDGKEFCMNPILSLPELVKPRQQLSNAFKTVINEQMMTVFHEERPPNEVCLTKLLNKEATSEHAIATDEAPSKSYDIFVYGRDKQKIQVVILDAFRNTISPMREIKTMIIEGNKLREASSVRFLAILMDAYHQMNSPDRVVIILEDFTKIMLSNFLRAGFIVANRAKGIKINVVCWSSDKFEEDIMREFSELVFVPSCKEEAEEVVESGNVDVVNQPQLPVSSTVDLTNEKNDQERKQWSSPAKNERDNTDHTKERENLTGVYAGLRHALNEVRSSEATTVAENSMGCRETTVYTVVQPVCKKEKVTLTTVQPPITKEPKATSMPISASGQNAVVWKAQKPDAVSIVTRDSVEEGTKTEKRDTRCKKVGCLDCMVEVFVCFFD